MSIADIVNGWARERVANGAIARDTAAYNQVVAALPDLIARLASGEDAPATAPAPTAPAPARADPEPAPPAGDDHSDA